MADNEARELLVQVCLECGKEYMFEETEPPDDLTCEKCGNTVFRSFYANPVEDEVETDFRESTERDTATDDGAGEVTRGDLQDLGNL
jgi:DNA-directed RNA polymerase subunit RPC12/RpoP